MLVTFPRNNLQGIRYLITSFIWLFLVMRIFSRCSSASKNLELRRATFPYWKWKLLSSVYE